MIANAFPENNPKSAENTLEPIDPAKEAKRNRARQAMEETLEDQRVVLAYGHLLLGAKRLREAGRSRDGITVLKAILATTLRTHFLLLSGREDAADLAPEQFARKLRSLGALDRDLFETIVRACRSQASDPNACQQAESLVRRLVQMTFGSAADAVDVRIYPARATPPRVNRANARY